MTHYNQYEFNAWIGNSNWDLNMLNDDAANSEEKEYLNSLYNDFLLDQESEYRTGVHSTYYSNLI